MGSGFEKKENKFGKNIIHTYEREGHLFFLIQHDITIQSF